MHRSQFYTRLHEVLHVHFLLDGGFIVKNDFFHLLVVTEK